MTTTLKQRMSVQDKASAVASFSLIACLLGFMGLACFALVYDAWHYGDQPSEAQIRWELLDNEWDRNMHDPTQRPPDSIADEARLKMLLLEEKDKQ
jgi:hypothetical protein